jgi:hypothetical protein
MLLFSQKSAKILSEKKPSQKKLYYVNNQMSINRKFKDLLKSIT